MKPELEKVERRLDVDDERTPAELALWRAIDSWHQDEPEEEAISLLHQS